MLLPVFVAEYGWRVKKVAWNRRRVALDKSEGVVKSASLINFTVESLAMVCTLFLKPLGSESAPLGELHAEPRW